MRASMKKTALAAAFVMSIGLAGCATTASNDDLAARVSALEDAVATAQASADAASSIAQQAQNTANMALGTARNAQACCEVHDEKMDRMFEKASSK